MRTTLSLDDDVFPLVRTYARNRSLGLGKAVSELVRRGLSLPRATRTVDGLEVFDLPEDSPKISTKMVRALDNDSADQDGADNDGADNDGADNALDPGRR